ncbi:MAG TPA: SGNH/GDSL hydrolase family protein, partial [Bacteroidetes bacterium]|nr:SGNH/GDSL hydrolase family protein [Bacteroidota bacterium]
MSKKQQLTRKKKLQYYTFSFIIVFLLLGTLGEMTVRIVVAMRSTTYPLQTTISDDKMGWTARPGFVFDGTVPDAAGNLYEIHLTTDANGFKYYGNPQSERKKLLVLGDSYTHATQVSNDKSYYGLLLDSLQNVELFAFGASGIGTLQEYIWLEQWYHRIRPDAILLQFCFNDVFNSSYELESQSYFNNNRRRRPYLENGKIVYKNPAPLGLGTIRAHSLFVDFILSKIESILEKNAHKKALASEDIIQKKGKNYPPYHTALTNLEAALLKIKSLTGDSVPILALQTDMTEPFISDIRDIFEAHQIPVVASAAEKIDHAIKNGQPLLAKDHGHWNEAGHAIVAKEIWPYLKKIIFSTPPPKQSIS